MDELLMDLSAVPPTLAWPLAAALAWVLGELAHRQWQLPRVSVYGLLGFALGHDQLGWLRDSHGPQTMLLANLAFGLVLFEFGHRINLRWLQRNPWLTGSGVVMVLLIFAAVTSLMRLAGQPWLASLLVGALAMATSPAALMRVVNEQRAGGQVTERSLHLAAIGCVLAVFVFKLLLGLATYERSGNLGAALWNSAVVAVVSVALGACFGAGVPALLRLTGRLSQDATVAFALGVVLLVALTHTLQFSPLLATLTMGLVARHRRVVLTPAQRNFGALGDLLAVPLFMMVAAMLSWQHVWQGLWLGLLLVLVRASLQLAVLGATARVSGTSLRKGLCTALAMTPMSVFVILLLEQSRLTGLNLLDQVMPLAAATLVLELIGPLAVQQALQRAGEAVPHGPATAPAASRGASPGAVPNPTEPDHHAP